MTSQLVQSIVSRVTLPTINSSRRERPCLPITIRSARSSCARSRTTALG